jgi:hypothetical protein
MKADEEIVEIREAFDLTPSYPGAAEVRPSHAHWERRTRGVGADADAGARDRLIDSFKEISSHEE